MFALLVTSGENVHEGVLVQTLDLRYPEGVLREMSNINVARTQIAMFRTQEEAHRALCNSKLELAKQYTGMIKQGLPSPVPSKCRSLFAYVGRIITPFPGIYYMSLDTYYILKTNYDSDIKLAEDVKSITIPYNDVIVFHDDVYGKCKTLLVNDIVNMFSMLLIDEDV